MKFRFMTVLLTILMLFIFYSCNSQDPGPESTDNDIQSRSFFYSLEKDGKTNYILGSIHVGTEDIYPLNDIILRSFEKSDILVVEADIGTQNQAQIMELIMELGYFTQGSSLRTAISEDSFEIVSDQLESLGYDINDYIHLKPWMLALFIMPIEMLKMGYSAEYGIDLYFLEKANDRQMKVEELEGVEYQLRLFNSFPKEMQEMFLINALLQIDGLKDGMDHLLNIWQKGDAEVLLEFYTDNIAEVDGMEKFYEILNDKRNFVMHDKIMEYFQDDATYFIVVGALHLVGDNGLINLLTESGCVAVQLPAI